MKRNGVHSKRQDLHYPIRTFDLTLPHMATHFEWDIPYGITNPQHMADPIGWNGRTRHETTHTAEYSKVWTTLVAKLLVICIKFLSVIQSYLPKNRFLIIQIILVRKHIPGGKSEHLSFWLWIGRLLHWAIIAVWFWMNLLRYSLFLIVPWRWD